MIANEKVSLSLLVMNRLFTLSSSKIYIRPQLGQMLWNSYGNLLRATLFVTYIFYMYYSGVLTVGHHD